MAHVSYPDLRLESICHPALNQVHSHGSTAMTTVPQLPATSPSSLKEQ